MPFIITVQFIDDGIPLHRGYSSRAISIEISLPALTEEPGARHSQMPPCCYDAANFSHISALRPHCYLRCTYQCKEARSRNWGRALAETLLFDATNHTHLTGVRGYFGPADTSADFAHGKPLAPHPSATDFETLSPWGLKVRKHLLLLGGRLLTLVLLCRTVSAKNSGGLATFEKQ